MFAIENTVEESIVLLSTNKRLKYIEELEDPNAEDDSLLTAASTSASVPTVLSNQAKDLSIAESITLTRSGGIDTLINRGQGEGESVSNSDLWDAFFCAGASSDMSKTMNLETMAKIQ
jgi:E3 ubiquitin-protein ligase SHPRH